MKWEYYWLPFDATHQDMDKIDKLGLEGWEFVCISPINKGVLESIAVLKRQKKTNSKQVHEK